jgi:hypothetical protein
MKTIFQEFCIDEWSLYARGWTRTLKEKYICPNSELKQTIAYFNPTMIYYLGYVEQIEKSEDFLSAFQASVKRRKLTDEQIRKIEEYRINEGKITWRRLAELNNDEINELFSNVQKEGAKRELGERIEEERMK